jgi:transcriptional regulator with XRE-family HTH domain
MSDHQTFGLRLRRERERRGVSLETIAAATKVGADLWDGLERNDFSRWPSGIFARAFVRDYARVIGLDAEELVDEFCRLFPLGDRRTDRLITAQAVLIGHQPAALSESSPLPAEGDRRQSALPPKSEYLRLLPRVIGAAVDAVAAMSLGATCMLLFDTPFWASVGVMAILYHAVCNVAGATPGSRVATELRQRVPAMFPVAADRRRVPA